MDQHPVPQDITGFQFKLVGDMTLKQFGYLAAGVIIAWFFYITNWNPIVKWPLVLFSVSFGVALAFLPIQERPLETWIVNFFKSVYHPTQYVWKKSQNVIDFTTQKPEKPEPIIKPMTDTKPITNEEQLENYLQSMVTVDDLNKMREDAANAPPVPTVDTLIFNRSQDSKRINQELKKVKRDLPEEPSAEAPDVNDLAKMAGFAPPPPPDNTTFAIQEKQRQLNEAEAINRKLLTQIDDLKKKIDDLSKQHRDQSDESKSFQKELSKMQEVMEELNKEKVKLQEQIEGKKKQAAQEKQAARVKFADKIPVAKVIDGKLPPNTIHGLVDDTRGVALSGVIILVKNANGSPVRALRTNKLGQFIATTPLENGVYAIESEKEGYTFDEIKVELTGVTPEPITIKAK